MRRPSPPIPSSSLGGYNLAISRRQDRVSAAPHTGSLRAGSAISRYPVGGCGLLQRMAASGSSSSRSWEAPKCNGLT